MSDFLKCPRSYYLKNVYKDAHTGHKITLMGPALALGQTVHEVLEGLSILPVDQRFQMPLLTRYENAWKKVTGKNGGFWSVEQEHQYKTRGADMLRRVMTNPGPLKRKAVKIRMDLPHYWLSEVDGIILCGRIDWLEYFPDTDTVAIIDFKTGKIDEDPTSLQLPIYHLLVAHCQQRRAIKAYYWYLDRHNDMTEKELPDLAEAAQRVLEIAKQIKLARKLELFKCPAGEKGCKYCTPFEKIIRGEAECVGQNEFRNDVYVLSTSKNMDVPESDVL
jgi:hypothetical protein